MRWWLRIDSHPLRRRLLACELCFEHGHIESVALAFGGTESRARFADALFLSPGLFQLRRRALAQRFSGLDFGARAPGIEFEHHGTLGHRVALAHRNRIDGAGERCGDRRGERRFHVAKEPDFGVEATGAGRGYLDPSDRRAWRFSRGFGCLSGLGGAGAEREQGNED